MAKKTKVIIVDDDFYFAQLYDERLKLAGYDVKVESHSENAIETIKKFLPDIVVLDLMMPLVSGKEVLDRLRADKEIKDTKVVILTALPENNRERKEIESKSDDYLIKSEIVPKDLVDLVEKMAK